MKKTLRILIFSFVFLTGFKASAFNVDTLFICKNDYIIYKSQSSGADTAVAWLWTFQGGSTSSSNIKNPQVVYPTAGVFLTTVKITFQSGRDTTDKVWVAVRDWPIPSFTFPKDTGYCVGGSLPLTLNTIAYPGVTYNWSTGATTSSIVVNTQGKYWVQVVLHAGRTCDSVYKEVNITEYAAPTVYLGQDKTMCQNQNIILNAGSGTGYKYLWAPNGEVTQTLNITLPGVYKVTVTNKEGCPAEDEIELVDSCPHYVFVPNAVSPNEDLLNDFFVKVWNFTPRDYTFSIYNRWGELLFESTDPKAGWNCKVNDAPVQQDIYVYKITYFDNDKKWYEMRGTFFVVR